MISVVIPLYNKERQVLQTLQTVFAQSYTDYEVVVVDDGSTDSGAALVESLGDSRIRLIHQANVGVSAARNRGIAEARGEYVAFLDADDEWDSDYLATQMSLAERYPTCSVFATNYRFRDQLGRETPTILRHLRLAATDGILTNYFEVASDSHPPICSISIMVRTTAIRAVGGFPLGIKSGEDLLTWARLAVRYPIAYTTLPKATYNIGLSIDNITKKGRPHDKIDYVGSALKELYAENRDTYYLRQYLSLWHKMRASVHLAYNKSLDSIKESLTSLKYNPLNYKVYVILALSLMPKFIRTKILSLR
jgi:glycosyltransferase involved in cell wall biosynthesis